MSIRQQVLSSNEAAALPGRKRTEIQAGWRSYKQRQTVAVFLLFGAIPVAFAALLLSILWPHHTLPAIFLVAAWWASAGFAVWWSGEARCPRCRRRFGALGAKQGISRVTRGLFDDACNNCKLRKFEDFRVEGTDTGTLEWDPRQAGDHP